MSLLEQLAYATSAEPTLSHLEMHSEIHVLQRHVCALTATVSKAQRPPEVISTQLDGRLRKAVATLSP